MKRGDIITWNQMAAIDEAFQQGMKFYVNNKNYSILNMSVRSGAPYLDKWEADGKTIIYEGHDAKGEMLLSAKEKSNQPTGPMCENGRFIQAVTKFKAGQPPRSIKIYEKIQSGIWVYNGFFILTDYWQANDENNPNRKVCKFKLEAIDNEEESVCDEISEIEHARLIPSYIKAEVFKRDNGCCRICGAKINLHYDHILPYSKGGTSTDPKNIQILCAKCNLAKGAKII